MYWPDTGGKTPNGLKEFFDETSVHVQSKVALLVYGFPSNISLAEPHSSVYSLHLKTGGR